MRLSMRLRCRRRRDDCHAQLPRMPCRQSAAMYAVPAVGSHTSSPPAPQDAGCAACPAAPACEQHKATCAALTAHVDPAEGSGCRSAVVSTEGRLPNQSTSRRCCKHNQLMSMCFQSDMAASSARPPAAQPMLTSYVQHSPCYLCLVTGSPMCTEAHRMSILSESNSMAASALASSVLPTPVGPRNRNEEPAGGLGLEGQIGCSDAQEDGGSSAAGERRAE